MNQKMQIVRDISIVYQTYRDRSNAVEAAKLRYQDARERARKSREELDTLVAKLQEARQ